MAIFGNKKGTTKAVADKKSAKAIPVGKKDVTWAIRAPRITEKAALQAEKGVYVFNIAKAATKGDVARAVFEAYNVIPVSVNIAQEPSKTKTRRKRSGVTTGSTSGSKKAYVTLKKGDTIQFV
jgi:large subunit ribosomal protein L23